MVRSCAADKDEGLAACGQGCLSEGQGYIHVDALVIGSISGLVGKARQVKNGVDAFDELGKVAVGEIKGGDRYAVSSAAAMTAGERNGVSGGDQ